MIMPTAPQGHWPVYVISLADAADRRRRICAQLDRLSIPFDFVEAIDGRRGLAPEFEPMIDRPGTEARLGHRMTDAEYACALSHMSVYRKIIDGGLPGAIVLEDDAILGPLFSEFLDARGYEAGGLVQLDHLHGTIWRFDRQPRLTAHIRLARAARNSYLTTGYSISRSAAAHLLRHGLPLRGLADWPCDVTEVSAMLALPCVIGHPDPGDQDSSIESERALIRRARPRGKKSALRFFRAGYWPRWWFKRMTKRIS